MGLIYHDLDAWKRWRGGRGPFRGLFRGVRELSSDPRFQLFIGGNRPKILFALDYTQPSTRTALLGSLDHFDTTQIAILAPLGSEKTLPQHPWVTRIVFPDELPNFLDEIQIVVGLGNHTDLGAAAYEAAKKWNATYFCAQHTLLTPYSPPPPPDAHLLAWSADDAEFWRADHEVKTTVVGSQLFWKAAAEPIEEPDRSAAITYLGQLHASELPRGELAEAAEKFCVDHHAIYRPHPSEKEDRACHKLHERLLHRGVSLDQSETPVRRLEGAVVGVFSTGVLESAARGLPAWVAYPNPPEWLEEFWSRYGMERFGGEATKSPVLQTFEPGWAIHMTLDRHLGGG